ncbi:hypothetical protein A2115_01745 [Candidatus Woesebacteria bacterium GWA1_41_8]|jgi:hypothetical protein|uniref:Uncharacterized protein n=1 Tax=Candidatus Woesebacteria bacterium GWA1_41_8 TaxID=1802471 RepID=A0A1F7WIX9_9BACT|nr:MAG: hypothetical protein A2115_01745 [Candidatus Woesebacteria bacterium GWA1_41_8]
MPPKSSLKPDRLTREELEALRSRQVELKNKYNQAAFVLYEQDPTRDQVANWELAEQQIGVAFDEADFELQQGVLKEHHGGGIEHRGG